MNLLLNQVDVPALIRQYGRLITVENATGNLRGSCVLFDTPDLYELILRVTEEIFRIEAQERAKVWRNQK